MSYRQDPRDQYYNNQSQEGYAGGYQQGQLARNQDPRDQYYNNQSESYQEEYAGGYQQGQFANNRLPNNNSHPTPNSGTLFNFLI